MALNPIGDKFTKPVTQVAEGGDIKKTENLGKSITNFYNDTITKDYQAIKDDATNHVDGTRATAQLAADLGTLHDLQKAYYTQTGDASELSKFQDSSFVEDGSQDGQKINSILGSAEGGYAAGGTAAAGQVGGGQDNRLVGDTTSNGDGFTTNNVGFQNGTFTATGSSSFKLNDDGSALIQSSVNDQQASTWRVEPGDNGTPRSGTNS